MHNLLLNNRGVALLIAIFSLALMILVAMEVSYETNVEYVVASQKVNRLKAYYAAKAGVELSLLRVLLYKKAAANFGEQLGENKALLDSIWNFPFAWPPSKFISKDDVSRITLESMKKVEQESDLKATYITTIESEGGKIDINDLGSDIESLRKATQAQILQIFAREIENNETFNDKYRNFNFSELVNNIIDWVDENKESLNGGDERSYYQDFLEDHPSEMIPPNRPLKTLKELHMIAGMNDDFYRLLESKVTTFGIKGINVNYANAEIFKALDPLINDEIAQKIIERRNDPNEGLFKNEDDFVGFLGTLINTNQFNEAQIPLLFDTVYNFRIRSTGEFAKASREITVVTFDFDNLTGRMAELLDKQDESSGEGKKPDDDPAKPPPKTPDPNAKPSPPAKKVNPKGRPRIVYWQET